MKRVQYLRLLKISTIPLSVILIIAVTVFLRSCSANQLQSTVRIKTQASVLRFSNDSKFFFAQTHNGTICHYDVKGNLLGQCQLQGIALDFYPCDDDEELGVLIISHVFKDDKCIATPIDFIVINVADMSVTGKTRLFHDFAKNWHGKVLFSPATRSWFLYYSDSEKYSLFKLQSKTLEKQAEKVVEIPRKIFFPFENIYTIPEVNATIGLDFSDKSLLWNHLTNEITEKPTQPKASKFFSGPFPETIIALGKSHDDYCFLVFCLASSTPLYSSAPSKEMKKLGNALSEIAGISNDCKTALYFIPSIGRVLGPSTIQRLLVLDVPSMQVVAEETSRTGHRIRYAFLSPNGQYIATIGSWSADNTQYIDLYEIPHSEPRRSEEWCPCPDSLPALENPCPCPVVPLSTDCPEPEK